eukprot:CAMPEP_0180128352 /NCGR_PEP_ID=MMETSP0986-20121125/6707_1 /TAXON_ID=697907 /ORGANISM="non described non described, Strain CCMP2293" /LENGTH=124 /DNA_ID=CAMNT_0022067889 /DNA_START=47 /DNA_END=422 /DNA_ORIENTATION=+
MDQHMALSLVQLGCFLARCGRAAPRQAEPVLRRGTIVRTRALALGVGGGSLRGWVERRFFLIKKFALLASKKMYEPCCSFVDSPTPGVQYGGVLQVPVKPQEGYERLVETKAVTVDPGYKFAAH